jgi:hypothetical protein
MDIIRTPFLKRVIVTVETVRKVRNVAAAVLGGSNARRFPVADTAAPTERRILPTAHTV